MREAVLPLHWEQGLALGVWVALCSHCAPGVGAAACPYWVRAAREVVGVQWQHLDGAEHSLAGLHAVQVEAQQVLRHVAQAREQVPNW